MEIKVPTVGDLVIWHDPVARPFNALVTCVFRGSYPGPAGINVVIISGDPAKDDSYGRQIERYTSVLHKSVQPAHGNYWRWPEEEPNPVVEPSEK